MEVRLTVGGKWSVDRHERTLQLRRLLASPSSWILSSIERMNRMSDRLSLFENNAYPNGSEGKSP